MTTKAPKWARSITVKQLTKIINFFGKNILDLNALEHIRSRKKTKNSV